MIEGSDHGPRFALLQTDDFVAELHRAIEGARHRILIQLMTFDGDRSGQEVARRLEAAVGRGVKVRLLVDCFALRFVSDCPVNRRAVRDEAEATWAMYRRLRRSGVELTFTHPHGPANLFSLARNHKKLFVVDDDVYLGGINVSDHNFSWHDFMVRVRDERILSDVVEDFEFSLAGGRRSIARSIVTNREVESVFSAMVLEARHSIELASPYAIDVGLTQLFDRASATHKRVITSRRSNLLLYRVMTPYLVWRLRRSGTSVDSYANFSHSKFLLVDDERLLIGSSNFGRHSFWCNQEVCLLIDDPQFIQEFKATLLGDTEPVDGPHPAIKVAFGGFVAWMMHACLVGLRFTVASRVPNLSRR